MQPILVVHHQQLVDARVLREELVGLGDGVPAQFLLVKRVDLGARRERLRDLAFGVTRFHDMAREQPHQLALAVHDRKRAKGKSLFRYELQHLADQLLGRNLDGFLDQAMNIILHPADLRKLLPLGHVVMDDPQPAVERQGDGHARLGHRVHVRRDHRDVKLQPLGERGIQLRVAGQDFRVKRRECDVVVGQPNTTVSREKGVRRFIKLGIEAVGFFGRWHVRTCQTRTALGKPKRANGRHGIVPPIAGRLDRKSEARRPNSEGPSRTSPT